MTEGAWDPRLSGPPPPTKNTPPHPGLPWGAAGGQSAVSRQAEPWQLHFPSPGSGALGELRCLSGLSPKVLVKGDSCSSAGVWRSLECCVCWGAPSLAPPLCSRHGGSPAPEVAGGAACAPGGARLGKAGVSAPTSIPGLRIPKAGTAANSPGSQVRKQGQESHSRKLPALGSSHGPLSLSLGPHPESVFLSLRPTARTPRPQAAGSGLCNPTPCLCWSLRGKR